MLAGWKAHRPPCLFTGCISSFSSSGYGHDPCISSHHPATAILDSRRATSDLSRLHPSWTLFSPSLVRGRTPTSEDLQPATFKPERKLGGDALRSTAVAAEAAAVPHARVKRSAQASGRTTGCAYFTLFLPSQQSDRPCVREDSIVAAEIEDRRLRSPTWSCKSHVPPRRPSSSPLPMPTGRASCAPRGVSSPRPPDAPIHRLPRTSLVKRQAGRRQRMPTSPSACDRTMAMLCEPESGERSVAAG